MSMRAGRKSRSSLALRAGLAVTLMVLFYALAIAATAALIWLGVRIGGSILDAGRVSVGIVILGIACFIAAGVIVWSVMPRFDTFEPPGPEVTSAQHPDLFAEIARVAEATGQREPEHVYLVSDVNAFVAQRGGFMGFGASRVMGIGLPLMRTLSVDELRAVLAHEMGHFYGGDTKLGPWIYKTRGALVRTVFNLGRATQHASVSGLASAMFVVIHAPFRWFLLGFMRVSQAISRAQEYSADAVAVRAEGQRAMIEGLKKTHAAAIAHLLYMHNDVAPLLEHGKLPDVGEGFSRYLANDRLNKLLDEVVEDELSAGHRDPYDSHPPLRERIAAASEVEGPSRQPDPRFAISLVRDPDTIELADIERRVNIKLERISWNDTASIWEKRWRAELAEPNFPTISAVDVTTDVAQIRRHAAAMLGEGAIASVADDEILHGWMHVVFVRLACQLLDAGFKLSASPGVPYTFTKEGVSVEIYEDVRKRVLGELSPDEWRAKCELLGLTTPDLPPRRAAAT